MSSDPPPDVKGTRSVLFVCLGNICRSPLAQGVFEHLTEQAGVRAEFVIESCGIGDWHVGAAPDERSIAVARRHGVHLRSRARQVDPATDFRRFELLIAMDRRNLSSLLGRGCDASRVRLFLDFAPRGLAEKHGYEVPDPYCGGPEGFDEVYELVHASGQGLLRAVL